MNAEEEVRDQKKYNHWLEDKRDHMGSSMGGLKSSEVAPADSE